MSNNSMKLLSICIQTGLHQAQNPKTGVKYAGRNMPAMIVGLPGIGKTQIITKLCEELEAKIKGNFPCEVFVAPQRMPEEVSGIPCPDYEKNEVRCMPMSIGKKLLKEGQGVFFIDEYSSANQAMGGACMTMIQDGRFGDEQLPHSVARVAAMNPPSCAANGRELTAPESNRFCFINWEVSIGEWIDYMNGGPGTVAEATILPEDWELNHRTHATSLVTAYLKANQSRFDVKNTMPQAHKAGEPWASPRSWENSSRLLAACMSLGERPDSDLAFMAVAGCVGQGDAESFLAWFREMDLPDPEDLLKDVKAAAAILKKLERRADKMQVVLWSLVMAAVEQRPQKERVKRWEAAWDIVGPYVESKPDVALYAAKELAKIVQQVPEGKVPAVAIKIKALLKKTGVR